MIRRITKEPIPKTLYKYRDWSNEFHKRLITNQELYFAKPSEFNDPFDGNIPIRWDLMTYEDCFKQNLNLLNTIHGDKDQNLVKAYAKKITDEKELWHPDSLSKESPEQQKKWDSIIGLCSLSAVKDNILMWSHYGANHTGIAIGFDSKSLSQNYDFDYIEPINYQYNYPEILGTEGSTSQFHKKFFYKSDSWKYEKEWRISKNHIENRIIKINVSTISEVILGCCINANNEKNIIRSVEKNLQHDTPIYKAFKIDNAFGLNFERIK